MLLRSLFILLIADSRFVSAETCKLGFEDQMLLERTRKYYLALMPNLKSARLIREQVQLKLTGSKVKLLHLPHSVWLYPENSRIVWVLRKEESFFRWLWAFIPENDSPEKTAITFLDERASSIPVDERRWKSCTLATSATLEANVVISLPLETELEVKRRITWEMSQTLKDSNFGGPPICESPAFHDVTFDKFDRFTLELHFSSKWACGHGPTSTLEWWAKVNFLDRILIDNLRHSLQK
jgi:hypothetical protein